MESFKSGALSMWQDLQENLISLKILLEQIKQSLEEAWAKFSAS